MRTPLVALAASLVGFIVGWTSHRGPVRETIRYVVPPPSSGSNGVAKAEPTFPEMPKPPLDAPEPTMDAAVATVLPTPAPLTGDLPKLPPASDATAEAAPLTPAKGLPLADLNADEARARQVVLRMGAEVVSSADAQDPNGKVGRSLIAEVAPGGATRLQSALREALGSRVVTSDGGTVAGSTTEVRKAEDELTALKKQLEKAQDDFLPNAPALKNVEDAYREGERNLAEVRRTYARQRLNILLRPAPGG